MHDILNLLKQALQEFTELINNGIKKEITIYTDDDTPDVPNTETDLEKIKSVLPFWPRLYCKLSNDNDRRVREYAHKAHLQSKYTCRRPFKNIAIVNNHPNRLKDVTV
jgi:hypothetical protein